MRCSRNTKTAGNIGRTDSIYIHAGAAQRSTEEKKKGGVIMIIIIIII